MKRRVFLKVLPLLAASGCGLTRIDPWHVFIRSDQIDSLEQERAILSKARLTLTKNRRIRVLYVQGTPYEMGYQHGVLLREEIKNNIGYIYDKAIEKFHFPELFDEAYERMRPFIPQEYIDEMHGLAHGAKMPLRVIQGVHVLPSIGEWGGKRRIKKVIKKMMAGELGTSCSNFSVNHSASIDNNLYVVRILDWGLHRISKLHSYPLILVAKPDGGVPFANIGWVGFLGAVSGMNAQGITLGEMGYGSPPNETLRGMPMPFLLRDVLSKSSNLADVRKIIKDSVGTNSFVFLMTDGKTGESQLYVKDRDRFVVSGPGEHVKDGDEDLPAIKDIVYGGHYNEKMTEYLNNYHGKISPEFIMDTLVPAFVMKSNFQNVIYDPKNLRFWVNNAISKKIGAQHAKYTEFNLAEALRNF